MAHAVQAPGFATLRAGRAVETRVVAGRLQAVAWDVPAGSRRVVTDRPYGVDLSEIQPDGEWIWWFDTDPAGEGIWRREPFEPFTGGGPGAAPALSGVPRGRAYGIAFDRTGRRAAVGVGVGDGTRVYAGTPGSVARLVGEEPGCLVVTDMSPDGSLLALAGSPDGDDAVVLSPTGTGSLSGASRVSGGPHLRLWPMEFGPDAGGDPELLLVAQRADSYTVACWTRARGLRLLPALSFPSEISVRWYGTGRGVLVQCEQAGRSRLLMADLDDPGDVEDLDDLDDLDHLDGLADLGDLTGARTRELACPAGTIHDLSAAPDGALHCVWSRESVPPRSLVIGPEPHDSEPHGPDAVPEPEPEPAADTAQRSERWTPRPYGRIHSFVTTPPGRGPWPTLFLVHGGPATHDRDAYDPRVGLFTEAGYAVVRSNYRGSTGYGTRWQHDYAHRVGLAQIEDLAAVRAELVADGVAVADRVGLCGFSWGGYLALLALGAQPQLWSLGLAAYPIADYVAAYRATTPALRAMDRQLFGGTPEEVPARYLAACPTTYADRIRAPVLVVASADDERCPPDQIAGYAAQLRKLAVPHEVAWVDGGHRSLRAVDLGGVLAAMLRFTESAWQGPPTDTPVRPASGWTYQPPEGGEFP